MHKFILFSVVALGVIFLGHRFLYKSHIHFLNIESMRSKLAVIVFYTLMFAAVIFSTLYTRSRHGDFANQLYYTASLWLPVLNYLIIYTFLAWLILFTGNRFCLKLSPKLMQYFVFALTAITLAWGIFKYYKIEHKVIQVKIKDLPAAWEHKKVLLISDLHIGNYRDENFVKKAVGLLNSQNPDILFIAGDLFDGAAFDTEKIKTEIKGLKANEAIYFTYGNHEHYSDNKVVKEISEAAGFTVLNNETVRHENVLISGIRHEDMQKPEIFSEINTAIAENDKKLPHIFISHEPVKNIERLKKLNVSLQLSGHTHGGQFFPFNIITRIIYGKMNYGLSRHGSLKSYTSSGMGIWGPAFRFMSQSEFVEIRFSSI